MLKNYLVPRPEVATLILRLTASGLFLWFGASQLLSPADWFHFLPAWTGFLPVPAAMFVRVNGLIEVLAAIWLALGIYTRPLAFLLFIHLVAIAITATGATKIRDLALAFNLLALAYLPTDKWGIKF